MSSCIFNMRIGLVHFQILEPNLWRYNGPIRISVNHWYKGKLGKTEPYLEIY